MRFLRDLARKGTSRMLQLRHSDRWTLVHMAIFCSKAEVQLTHLLFIVFFRWRGAVMLKSKGSKEGVSPRFRFRIEMQSYSVHQLR